ncbi:MAG: RNA 2',3'-cyclic phosphodiesterase [Pseudomonadota bacterium]
MIRSFIALSIPEPIADLVDDIQTGLRGVHWTPGEDLHLTLAFLGDQDRHSLADLDAGMVKLDHPRIALTLSGVDAFGGGQPRSAHVGVVENPDLRRLHEKVAQIARRARLEIEERRFAPHVTIARWRRGAVGPEAMARFAAAHNLFRAGPFEVDAVRLFRSDLGRDGPRYEEMAAYPLGRAAGLSAPEADPRTDETLRRRRLRG